MNFTTTRIVSANRQWLILAVVAAVSLMGHGPAGAQQTCGDGREGLKVNYTDPKDAAMLNNINNNHFNSDVQNLRRGETGMIEGDLDYVLRNAPNHHRGLYVMSQYHLRERTEKFEHETYSMLCWFERAMRFAPTDAVVPMIYGIYLHKRTNMAEAERQYKHALDLAPDFAEAHYNLGLLYVDWKRFDDALTQAHEAYRLGYPLPGLREKLAATGAWKAQAP